MQDHEIIDLYFERDENAISETKVKYEKYLKTISLNVLYDEAYSESTKMKQLVHDLVPTYKIDENNK